MRVLPWWVRAAGVLWTRVLLGSGGVVPEQGSRRRRATAKGAPPEKAGKV